MREKTEELDLNNPIFAFYIDVSGLSRQKAEEQISQLIDNFDIYKNVTMWFIPISNNGSDSRIECIYDGWGRNRDVEISNIIEQINTRIDILSNSKNFDDFKMQVRNWRLGEVLDGTEEK